MNSQKQQIITGLSFDVNVFFISNKYLSTRTKVLLEKCNYVVERGQENPFELLSTNFEKEKLPLIREILTNGFLVQNLDEWKKGLLNQNSVVQKLVNYYEQNEEIRNWVLLELSKFSNSNFESIRYFIKIFFIKLSKKKYLLKNVLQVKNLDNEIYSYTYKCLSFAISKITNYKFHNDKNFLKDFGDNLMIASWKGFYLNSMSGEQKELEIKRIIKILVDFIIRIPDKELLKNLILIFKRCGNRSTEVLFLNFDKVSFDKYYYWAEEFAKPFLSWSNSQRELHRNFINFILKCLRLEDVEVSAKQQLIRRLKNSRFFGFGKNGRYLINERKKKDELKRFYDSNSNRIELDIRNSIEKYLDIKPQRTNIKKHISEYKLNPKYYSIIISNIKNSDFHDVYDMLNESTNVMHFIKHVRMQDDPELQKKFNVFLNQKW